MNFDFTKVIEGVFGFFTKLSLAQKIALPLFVIGSMGTIVFVSNWASKPEYGILFSNLEESDAAGVVEYLKDHKIKYNLTNDSGTISVTPISIVHDIRLELSSAGLPKGGSKGFELFDSTSLTTSAVMEKINELRAKQGELERTIQAIDAVKTARVHITLPERSSFVKKDVVPTASVLLRLKAGAEILPAQVKAITHLVAGSIERMLPENVTIMDSKGNLLSDSKGEGDLSGDEVARLDYQRKIESSYAKRIETMISEILGHGKVVARVTADIDYNKFEKEEELYDPSGTVARSEKTVEDSASGKSSEGGVAGVAANLTNDPSLAKTKESSGGGGLHRESVKNFEVSRAVSRTAQAAGKIQRLSVAVLVDGQYIKAPVAEKTDKNAKEEPALYRPLSSEMIRKIDALVKQSVGYDSTRGDIITVENIQFLNDDSLEQQLAPTIIDKIESFGIVYVLEALFIILFFLIGVKPLIKFITMPSQSEVDLKRLLPEGLQELEAEIDLEGKFGVIPDVKLGINIEELEGLIAANSGLVKDNPQQAALLIRYWLNEGRMQ